GTVEEIAKEKARRVAKVFEDRTAEAIYTFAFYRGPGAKPILFQGRTKGAIVRPRDLINFSISIIILCDPIFEYNRKATFAKIKQEEKEV
ncbi:uncharacterized protein N7458_011251, partial [Penicillium daleae]